MGTIFLEKKYSFAHFHAARIYIGSYYICRFLFSALLVFHKYNSYCSCLKFGLLIKLSLKRRPNKICTNRSALEIRTSPTK